MTPDPARQAAYEAAVLAYTAEWGTWSLDRHRLYAAVDAVWDLAVEEGRRQSRALDPEVAEVVADTIEKFEECRFEPHDYGPSPDGFGMIERWEKQ